MQKKEFIRIYKVPLLLTFTLFVALLAVSVEREVLNIVLIFLGALLGTFFLDFDYIAHAYFVEPEKPNSGLVKDYIKHKDYFGLLNFIHTHKFEFEERTLNSALFQIILGASAVFVMSSSISIFLKVFILSAFVNSIYRFLEEYVQGQVTKWFWSLKIDTKPMNIYIYLLALLVGVFYQIYIF